MRITRKCFGCKQDFRKNELVEHSSPSGKTTNWYCPKCLQEKLDREKFSDTVCSIFGIKNPGPIIWTQRKRLQEKYGYTDDVIITCLEYIYKVEHKKILSESLVLVTPLTVEKALKYKKQQEYNENKLVTAVTGTQYVERYVKIKENIDEEKTELNPDDFLDDD